MRRLSFLILLLTGCELYDASPPQGPSAGSVGGCDPGPIDSGPICNSCPAEPSWGQACSFHQDRQACLYNQSEVCACINGQWRCGYVSGLDAGIPDAWIPPDAP